jgi:hypothetical protein
MILLAFLVGTAPAPLSREPFIGEEVAANAFEQQLNCVAGQTLARSKDRRSAKDVASDIVNACNENAQNLQSALTDVYRRKPTLLPAGQTAEQAAATYVEEMNNRVELLVEDGRKHK